METNIRSLFSLDFTIDEAEGIIGATLFGAFQASVILHFADLTAIKMLGATVGVPAKILGETVDVLTVTVGVPTLFGGAIMLFVYGLLLGLPFLVFVSGSVNSFVTQVIMLSSKSTVLQKLLVPLLNISALGVTLFALGEVYGIVVGIVFFGIAVPAWLTLIGYSGAYTLPYINLVTLFAWMTYGGMTGLVYGYIMEN
jgi:hypothetical protein